MKQAIIARVKCGCIVACDLDGSAKSIRKYLERGLTIESMNAADAIALMRKSTWPNHEPDCKGVKQCQP